MCGSVYLTQGGERGVSERGVKSWGYYGLRPCHLSKAYMYITKINGLFLVKT